MNVHYLADQVETHLQNREAPQIVISDERELLMETGGGLKQARHELGDDPVFCTNTDAILCDIGAEACAMLADAWDPETMDALLLLCPIKETSGYDARGDFFCDEAARLSFRGEADAAPYVFTGLQIINPSLIDEGPDGPFSTKLLWENAKTRGRLAGVIYDGFWLHVGDPQGLAAAEERLSLQG